MGIIDFIKNIFSPSNGNNIMKIFLKDAKCGNKIKLILRKSYDIQRIYEEDEEAYYRWKKVVICDNCFNKINVNIDFNRRYGVIDKKIDGGEFITEEEFNENQ
ncbi:MAG: hypothetical protein ACOCRK_04850 [bacterium]